MVKLGIPELTTEQTELLCSTAEETAKKYILSKISSKAIESLDISVEVEGEKPVNVTIEINLLLTSQAKDIDAESLVKEAVVQAHNATENYLRNLK
jgi:hypothetical protein